MSKEDLEQFDEQIREYRDEHSLQECIGYAGDNPRAVMVCEGLNPEYSAIHAEGFSKEIRQMKRPSLSYLAEKIKKQAEYFEVVEEDIGTEQGHKLWKDIIHKMNKYRGRQ